MLEQLVEQQQLTIDWYISICITIMIFGAVIAYYARKATKYLGIAMFLIGLILTVLWFMGYRLAV